MAGGGTLLGWAVQGDEDALAQDHADGAGQLTPERLWAEAERRISAAD